jgi:hypothetical protein
MFLAPCPATQERYWGLVIASAPSILALWDKAGRDGGCGYSWDQVRMVRDSKTDKKLSIKEYVAIVGRLRCWDVS